MRAAFDTPDSSPVILSWESRQESVTPKAFSIRFACVKAVEHSAAAEAFSKKNTFLQIVLLQRPRAGALSMKSCAEPTARAEPPGRSAKPPDAGKRAGAGRLAPDAHVRAYAVIIS